MALPADIRGLVEATYDDRAREERIARAANAERLRKAEGSRLAELDDYRAKAERVAIRPPDQRLVPERTQDDEALLAIRTRLGVSQQVLPVLWDLESCSAATLDGDSLPADPEAEDAFRRADALLDEENRLGTTAEDLLAVGSEALPERDPPDFPAGPVGMISTAELAEEPPAAEEPT